MKNLISIGFYNVENLFDIVNDPKTNDDEFRFYGNKKWDSKRYYDKLDKLSYTIDQIGKEETNNSPVLLGLAEVENKHVLKDLTENNQIKDSEYSIIHFDSPDERGIDVALLYKQKYFTITDSKSIAVDLTNKDGSIDYTRDILYVSGKLQNVDLHIFVIHFPSKRLNDINKDKRNIASELLRKHIDEIFVLEKSANIIVMGDFNDNPKADTVKGKLKTEREKHQLDDQALYNPMEKLLEEGEGSLFYKRNKFLFDQILFSKNLLNEDASIKLVKTAVFNADFLAEQEGKYKGSPFRTYIGKRYFGGYSDHFPVYSILEY
jgi:endonuclease/exonuclease/phosphatase family metal-dependent hydrolase